jgi:hypothetical protein
MSDNRVAPEDQPETREGQLNLTPRRQPPWCLNKAAPLAEVDKLRASLRWANLDNSPSRKRYTSRPPLILRRSTSIAIGHSASTPN